MALVGAIVAAIVLTALLAVSPAVAEIGFIVLIFSVGLFLAALKLSTEADRSWLPSFVLAGCLVKLAGAGMRYVTVVDVYVSGDSFGYHNAGTRLVEAWRQFTIPVAVGRGSPGTRFTEIATGLIYLPYVPSMLGGFLIFATLAFVGQVFLYTAFRRSAPSYLLRRYAFLVFFLPTLVFWPSSIGKDALMMLFLGVAAYGLARLLESYQSRWLVVSVIGLAGGVGVRPHIPALLVGGLVVAGMFARPSEDQEVGLRRLVVVGLSLVAILVVGSLTASRFDLQGLSAEEVAPFLEGVSERTATGGSVVEGGPVRNPLDFPGAFLTVLFRPFPYEAHNSQALLASLEGTLLFGAFVWKLPAMLRNRRQLRANPYYLMAFIYTMGFVVAFSAILNLGILARQRSQVLPLFVAVLVGLGWYRQEQEQEEPSMVETIPAWETAR